MLNFLVHYIGKDDLNLEWLDISIKNTNIYTSWNIRFYTNYSLINNKIT